MFWYGSYLNTKLRYGSGFGSGSYLFFGNFLGFQIYFLAFYQGCDPHHFNADPGPVPTFSIQMRIRILLNVHCPPRIYYDSLKLQNFDCNADPDPTPKNHADPDLRPCFLHFAVGKTTIYLKVITDTGNKWNRILEKKKNYVWEF